MKREERVFDMKDIIAELHYLFETKLNLSLTNAMQDIIIFSHNQAIA